MERDKSKWLMGSAAGLLLIAVVAALISAQWKHEAIPFAALCVVLVLTVVKSRIVVLDFMGLRGMRRGLSAALIAWPILFVVAAVAKAALASL
ncbi:cytochrome C oxidase subunit IV family protein [Rhizobium sp. LjRoot30]|uniref:cytochrome C oxidase subunit IV family protein n=1 Tax=Rhizobium sp. LjRoot30 TaxID=3342320 RepID=UPI003ECE3B36